MIISGASVQARSAASLTRERLVSEHVAIRVAESARPPQPPIAQARQDAIEEPELNHEQRRILSILERVFGANIRHAKPPRPTTAQTPVPTPQQNPGSGVGLRYQRSEELRERQQLELAFQGRITTSDGRKIGIDLRQVQEQLRVERRDLTVTMGDPALIDPLVLDLDGDGVSLTAERMQLDLDADGKLDDIARIENQDAFLVHDRDNDNMLDNGHELFGPSSGDGYAELARLDDDGNGFIDAGDSAWSQLHLGRVEANGAVNLQTLADAGIGALSLQHVASPFAHYQDDRLQGLSRSSGYYLRDNGSAGMVTQVDFVA